MARGCSSPPTPQRHVLSSVSLVSKLVNVRSLVEIITKYIKEMCIEETRRKTQIKYAFLGGPMQVVQFTLISLCMYWVQNALNNY